MSKGSATRVSLQVTPSNELAIQKSVKSAGVLGVSERKS
jgi:hypothetical protein